MTNLTDQRKYKRCDNIICKSLVSREKIRWVSFDLLDISAGGILFTSVHRYQKSMRLYFNLYFYNMLAEFNIKLEGRVLRINEASGKNTYAVQFENMNKYEVVQLDELVKSKITVKENPHQPVVGEEYTMLLFPKIKPRVRKIRMKEYNFK